MHVALMAFQLPFSFELSRSPLQLNLFDITSFDQQIRTLMTLINRPYKPEYEANDHEVYQFGKDHRAKTEKK